MENQDKLITLYYKFDKGLVPAGSDLHFALSYIKELQNEINILHSARANREPAKVVRDDKGGRSKKGRIRKGSTVRTKRSTTKDTTMEGGA